MAYLRGGVEMVEPDGKQRAGASSYPVWRAQISWCLR